MSYYFNYSFVSPEPIFALVLEEFKSYFDTQSIDNLMFPIYVDKCLKKLGRSSYVIAEGALYLEDFEARLPDNFYAVREAWKCQEIGGNPYQTAESFYSQTYSTSIQISPVTEGEHHHHHHHDHHHHDNCHDPNCDGNCRPDILYAVYKTNHQVPRSYTKEYLLKPGNISARQACDVKYTDEWDSYSRQHTSIPFSSSFDSFDVRDNKFITNFRSGIVHLMFYATEYDSVGNQLVPDNFRILEYIEKFIKYKMFETLTNQCNDETFKQLQEKMMYYKQESEEAFIMAFTEIKKEGIYEKQRKIKQTLNRFNMYELPNRVSRTRRNN